MDVCFRLAAVTSTLNVHRYNVDGKLVVYGLAFVVGGRAQSICKDKTWTCVFTFGCGDVALNADYGLAVFVCRGGKSMSKYIKWMRVLFSPRRRPHSMCKDKTLTAGLLVIALQSLSAAEQHPCVKVTSGRVFSFGCGDVALNV